MTIIHTDAIKEDMVLSEDVRDVSGRLLLHKGQKLRSHHVDIMKKWGVTEVSVTDGKTVKHRPESETDQNEPGQMEQDLLPIFQYSDLDHPAIKELFRLAVFFRKEHNISHKTSHPISRESLKTVHYKKDDVRKKIVQKELKLPEIPTIVFELNEILSDPLSTADNLAQVVSKSPSLAAALLRIVNSSFYSFTSKIDTISRAVTIIGTREISSLAIAVCTISFFKKIPREILDMHSFLKHSIACGLISRMLAANRNIPQTERLFVAGLLHDIGRVIIYTYFPDQAKALLYQCITLKKMLHKEENTFLGCSHTDISRFLLQDWNFPAELEDSIFYHHNPMSADNPVQAAIVHLSDIIVNGLGIGSSGEKYVPPLDIHAWEHLKLPASSFEVIITQAVHQLWPLNFFLNSR